MPDIAEGQLVKYNAEGSLDIRGTAELSEAYYGQVSDAITNGQGLKSVIEALHVSSDAYGIAAGALWVLQNIPMPSIVQKVTSVTVAIGATAATGASVGALFGGVGAVFGAAAGGVIGIFQSLLGRSPPPPPKADSFDLLRQVVPWAEGGTVWASSPDSANSGVDPLGVPVGTIMHGQAGRIVAGVGDRSPQGKARWVANVADALGGDTTRAKKVIDALMLYHPFAEADYVNVRWKNRWGASGLSRKEVVDADAMANGGYVPDLLPEAALAALYTALPDSAGHVWTARDWYQYLMLIRRGWEYTLEGQRHGLAPDTNIKSSWHTMNVVLAHASRLPGVVPGAVEQGASTRRASSNLPPAVAAALKAGIVHRPGSSAHPTRTSSFGDWVRYYERL